MPLVYRSAPLRVLSKKDSRPVFLARGNSFMPKPNKAETRYKLIIFMFQIEACELDANVAKRLREMLNISEKQLQQVARTIQIPLISNKSF
jgi:hypothetical protein